ncbi:MAG TPA: transposase, partial [Burkholderiales bacterium]|nr:transposase [Burkholderiales bacterium]
PRVHNIAALLKRWLLGTHQGGVQHVHLDYYLDEFAFRFNRRRSKACSFQGAAFPLRIDTLTRLSGRSGAVPGSMDCR